MRVRSSHVAIVVGALLLAARAAGDAPGTGPAGEPYRPPVIRLAHGPLALEILRPRRETFETGVWPAAYGGLRFDFSGIVSIARYKDRAFIGLPGDAGAGRHALGTSDEFKPLLDLDEGRGRIRVGVGILERRTLPSGKRVHGLGETFPWHVERSERAVTFRQQVDRRPWGYDYTKRLEIDPSGRVLTIRRTLTNTGPRRLELRHYCHNWLRVTRNTGPGHVIELPFAPEAGGKFIGRVDGRRIRLRDLGEAKASFAALRGMSSAGLNNILLRHEPSGASLWIQGDWAPPDDPRRQFALYVTPTAVCPEVFIKLDLAPDQTRTWTARYVFSAPPHDAAEVRAVLRTVLRAMELDSPRGVGAVLELLRFLLPGSSMLPKRNV